MRKSKEVTVRPHSQKVGILLEFDGEELKKKYLKNKKRGTLSFFIALHPCLFISHVNLKDSSVADVSKILPLIIVAQCY